MKKIFLSTLISLFSFCTIFAQILNGDLNNDGKFTIADIVTMNNIIKKKVVAKVIDGVYKIDSETQLGTTLFGDLNHDGKFTFEDIKLMAETFLEVKEPEEITGESDEFVVREIKTADLVEGASFNSIIKTLANGHDVSADDRDEIIQSIEVKCNSDITSDVVVSTRNSDAAIYASFDDGKITISTSADLICPTSMSFMFNNLVALTSVDLSHFDTQNVTKMNATFQGCNALASIDLSGFDTRNVTDMNYMFNLCYALTTLDLSSFDTRNVTDMNGMFKECHNLESVDLSSFNTENVSNLSRMFTGCAKLTSLNLTHFNTSKVRNMSEMFFSCNALTAIDLSNVDTKNVTDMRKMFCWCSTLSSLILGKDFVVCEVSSEMCNGVANNVSSISITCTQYTQNKLSESNTYLNINKVNWIRPVENGSKAELIEGASFNTIIKTLANGYDVSADDRDEIIQSIEVKCNSDITSDVVVSTRNSDASIYASFDDGKIIISTSADAICPTSMSFMFNKLTALTSVDLSHFNTQNVTNMGSLFQGCNALSSIDLSGFDTRNVTDMSYMFNLCYALTSLDLSGFDTRNATDMNAMFKECTALKSLNLSSFDTSNVTDMSRMFRLCEALTSLYLGNDFAVCEEKTEMCLMVGVNASSIKIYCTPETQAKLSNETELDVEKIYWKRPGEEDTIAKITNGIFFNSIIKTLANDREMNTNNTDSLIQYIVFDCGSSVNSGQIVSAGNSGYPIYANYSDGKITISTAADAIYATDMTDMFYRLSALTSLDLSSFDTHSVTNMNAVFFACPALTSLNLSSFDTHNVTNMSAMFGGCSSLLSLDISNFDTSNVTDMNYMFSGCMDLTTLDLSLFNTENVTNMSGMFLFCKSLETLDISNFDTSRVTDMTQMLSNCNEMSNLNLGKDFVVCNVNSNMCGNLGSEASSITITCTNDIMTALQENNWLNGDKVVWNIY